MMNKYSSKVQGLRSKLLKIEVTKGEVDKQEHYPKLFQVVSRK
jgi:hypothetical protein